VIKSEREKYTRTGAEWEGAISGALASTVASRRMIVQISQGSECVFIEKLRYDWNGTYSDEELSDRDGAADRTLPHNVTRDRLPSCCLLYLLVRRVLSLHISQL
jgi:hypothetical protein